MVSSSSLLVKNMLGQIFEGEGSKEVTVQRFPEKSAGWFSLFWLKSSTRLLSFGYTSMSSLQVTFFFVGWWHESY